jgi:murein L,D-transpeptidase YafK
MLRAFLLATLLIPVTTSADDESRPVVLLPAYVIQIPESIQNVLIAEIESSTMYRYTKAKDGVGNQDARYMSIGQNGVGKQRSGDRRTPLGIYFVTEQLDTSRMHEKYGATAFPLDYPNIWDEMQSRSGDGIWIHGVLPGGGRRPPLDTDGCIALANADLLALEQHVQVMTTPVIITRKIEMRDAAELAIERDGLNAALMTWAESFRDGDWHRYQGLYANNFEYRGLGRDAWLAYRVQSSIGREIREISLDDILMLADPEEPGLFLSRFRQTIVGEWGQFVTVKRLYWRRSDTGDYLIVAEDNG